MNNTIFLIPSLTFLVVSSLALLGVWVWLRRFSAQAKAKAQRLNDLMGLRSGRAVKPSTVSSAIHAILDKWLRTHTGLYDKIGQLITQADSQRTPMQLLATSLGIWAITTVIGIYAKAAMGPVILFPLGLACLPVLQLMHSAKNRRRQFEAKLPEALDFMTRALRAGHSITVAIGMAGDELADPIRTEFKTVFDEIGFGISFEEAMTALSHRIQSADVNFLVTALLIQRETGGNLTELLDGLAKTVRERIKLQGKIKTLSSEGRLSAILLGALPFVLGGVLSFLNPEYMSVLWNTAKGHSMLMSGALLLALGFISLSRIVQIKV
jgi:tight adherence protein B